MKKRILTIFSVYLAVIACCFAGRDSLSLDGIWRFEMDPDKQGRPQQWNLRNLTDSIRLPGTMDQNKKGFRNTDRTLTTHLSRPFTYVGKAWYQRDIEIPDEWAGKHVTLRLERSKLTSVWIDGHLIGSSDCLGSEQVYDLSGKVGPGSHVLTICVDNETLPVNKVGHQITDQTQTNFNGIIGEIKLLASDPVWIKRALVYPRLEEKQVRVKLTIGNMTNSAAGGSVSISAGSVAGQLDHVVDPASYSFATDSTERTFDYIYTLGEDALEWDEFTPNLYSMKVALKSGEYADAIELKFGLREFKTVGTQFAINNRKTFLRGKQDALVWPILGHPSMDVDAWIRVFKIAKSYGINHYRFHSCTPPKAAFKAADIVGIYLQPELYSFGGDLSGKPQAIQYNIDEGLRILKAYGNHPSFVMFTLGNEMSGGRETRAEILRKFRAFDNSRLYAQASNYDFRDLQLAEEDDYWTTIRTAPNAESALRGSFSHADLPLGHIQVTSPSTRFDYSEAVKSAPVPLIGHETGQYQVFPNFDEIKKYSGVQKAWNLEVFSERLKQAGMYEQWPDFFKASGALAVICYREEIEAALRSPGFGGFQLLDLQDFPGQGTALVGILDAFMDSKGLITPEQWRQFCSEVVPLARFDKYTWQSGETLQALLQVANYGPERIDNTNFSAKIIDAKGNVLLSRQLPLSETPLDQGRLTDAGQLSFTIPHITVAQKLTIKLEIEKTPYKNEYSIWVYPGSNAPNIPDGVHVKRKLDAESLKLLGRGEKLLLFPELEQMPNSVEGFFASDFWSYPMFYNITKWRKMEPAPGTLGILCDPEHPALARFPTEFHSNWQWYHLIMNSRSMILNAAPKGFRPVVQVIDNFERNNKLGLIFECNVGKGKLLVCGSDLPNLMNRPEARTLYASLLAYMDSPAFTPPDSLHPELLMDLFRDKSRTSGAGESMDFNQFFPADSIND